MFKKFAQVFLVLFAVVLVTLTGVSDPAYAAKKKPQVIPPDAIFRGRSYGEWAASWWQAAFAVPVDNGKHPIINGGAFSGDDKVVFLAAVVGPPTTINIEIPAGTPLFVPVINSECSVLEPDPYHGDDETSLRECANDHIDGTFGLWAKIDGQVIENLDTYRVESPLFEFGPLPENNLFQFFGLDAPEGTTSDSVDAGVYLLLAPLKPGLHKLRVRGTFGGGTDPSLATTFKITVLPRD